MSFKNLRKFFRKRYRDVFGTSTTGTTAAQIQAMREKREWSQQMLAEKVGMGQARISLLENPNYEGLSLNTLKRIANVFDVALVVRFVPFSKLFVMLGNETQETLAVPSFEDEFGTEANPTTTPSAKIIDLTERLSALHIDGQHRIGLNADTYEVRQGSGVGSEVTKLNAPNVGTLPDPMGNYKPKLLGEGTTPQIGAGR
ncbi:helix-turn-helix domain-containing protein [Candidatus Binatus sp.]|uniref:helix-turn-helix domain-containing protein n=1 Tax=Candidatus Binatus sp. TaxID=2811406 RepID=UPI003C782312